MKSQTWFNPSSLSQPSRRPLWDAEAVGGLLVRATELMPALMRVDPKLDRPRQLIEKSRIENDEAGIGGAVVVELVIDHSRTRSALDTIVFQLELAIGTRWALPFV